MSIFSRLVAPYRKGEKNFERARAAELRRDFDTAKAYFQTAAEAFDLHRAKKQEKGQEVRLSHLVMAGICYTRLGRNEDGLSALDASIALKNVPDAFIHAGYAAAKLGHANKAMDYWSRYPNWADQRIIARALKEQIKTLQKEKTPDLQAICEAVAEAIFRQDKENAKLKTRARGKKMVPVNRGY